MWGCGVTVVLFQPCDVLILARSRQTLKRTRAPYSFSLDFVDLLLLSKVCLCQLNICVKSKLVRPYTLVCMLNRLRHNRLVSALGQVIRLDLASIRGQGFSMQRHISSSHLGFQQHDPCIVMSSYVSRHLEHPSIRVLIEH